VRSLGVDAHVNDRNDIYVGQDKVSGSAYKIVNKRAYHHGTMLISTQLDTLGNLLRTNKDTMLTKGVASVRSSVCNLQQHNPSITHEAFAEAVIKAFQEEYGIDEAPCVIEENEQLLNLEYIQKGLLELPSWEWSYGQTPEFTYTMGTSFAWGDVTAEIKARHGVIQTCGLRIASDFLDKNAIEDLVNTVEPNMKGQRYGYLRDQSPPLMGPQRDLEGWLRRLMAS